MKEFQYKNGGRRLYNEDIARLQELALAISNVFADCGLNFVISGCKVTRKVNAGYSNRLDISVTKGFVWLDGKIREVAATTVNAAPSSHIPAIAVLNTTNNSQIKYADSSSGPGYYDYGSQVVTGAVSDFSEDTHVIYDAENLRFPDIRDFIAYYALSNKDEDWLKLKAGALTCNGGQVLDEAIIQFGTTIMDGGPSAAKKKRASISSDGLLVHGEKTTTIDENGVETSGTVQAATIKADAIECDSILIHDDPVTDDNGDVTQVTHKWSWKDFRDTVAKYKEIAEAVEASKATLEAVNAQNVADLRTDVDTIKTRLGGTDAEDGLLKKYEGKYAEMVALKDELQESLATVKAENIALKEQNIAMATKIENLQTNYAAQLSSIQALNNRVDSFSKLATASSQATSSQEASVEP